MIGTSVTPRASAWSSTRSSRRSGPPKKVAARRHEEVEGARRRRSATRRSTCAPSARRHRGRLQHPGDRRQRADHEDVVGSGRARAGSTKLRVAASMVLSECTTPFGRDVVPDVKITTDGSSGSCAELAPTCTRLGAHRLGVTDGLGEEPAGPDVPSSAAGAATRARARATVRSPSTMSRTWASPALDRRDHHQRAEAQHRVDRDHRDDVVGGEHEDRVVGGDALPSQRRDCAVDRGVELAVGERTARARRPPPVPGRGGGGAHEVDRIGAPSARRRGTVPRAPTRGQRRGRRAPGGSSRRAVLPLDDDARAPDANPESHVTVARDERDPAVPRRPCGRWSSRAPSQWADHVLLADDHGRSLTGRAAPRRRRRRRRRSGDARHRPPARSSPGSCRRPSRRWS